MAVSPNKQSVALDSLLVSAGLSALKMVAAVFTGSLAMLSEALHSLSDLVASLVTYFAVRQGDKPADDDHHYGHGEIESLAALFETGLLVAIAIYVAFVAIQRLLSGAHDVNFSWWAAAILLISIAVDFNRSRALSKAAVATSSEALAADAVHFSSDMWTSAAAIVGLVAVWWGLPWADSVVALLVCAFILRACFKLGRSSISSLLDTAPEGVAATVRQLTEGVPGVLEVRQVRVKPAGTTVFIAVSIDVPRTLSVTEIVDIKERVKALSCSRFANAEVTVDANPVAVSSESAIEQVRLIAQHHGMAIHHLAVQDVAGRLAISYDLEVDGETSLSDAHAKATVLESQIRDALGGSVEVETHIEPLPQRTLEGREAAETLRRAMLAKLENLALQYDSLGDLHNVRLRETDGALYLHYHCRFAPNMSVQKVHDVIDALEREIRRSFPGLARVVAHAEPIRAASHQL